MNAELLYYIVDVEGTFAIRGQVVEYRDIIDIIGSTARKMIPSSVKVVSVALLVDKNLRTLFDCFQGYFFRKTLRGDHLLCEVKYRCKT